MMKKDNPRYQRQIVLPEIGRQGQDKIASSSVLCVGAGGLGCPALLYLAAAGIGRIGIVDFDLVDESNLQRQVIFSVDQIGKNKAQAAAEKLKGLNSEIEIIPHCEMLNDKNILDIFKDYDVIIDGTDNFAAKFLINDAAVKTGKPFIYGSILGFDGQVSVFGLRDDNGNYPCYRCLFPKEPQAHIPNCAQAGVIGAVAGVIGTVQAMEAIKLIVADKSFSSLAGKLWIIDMHSMENRLLSLPKDDNCPVCSKPKEDIELVFSSPACGSVPEISTQEAKAHPNALMVDVREADEWAQGHVEGAEHIALSKLIKGFKPSLPLDKEIILYCKKGQRSKQAAQILKGQGYMNIRSMAGGFDAWQEMEDQS